MASEDPFAGPPLVTLTSTRVIGITDKFIRQAGGCRSEEDVSTDIRN